MTNSFSTLASRKRILILDDEELMRRLLLRILDEAGYDVQEAPSGEEAIRIAEMTPDLALVIADVVMPGMAAAAAWQAISLSSHDARVLFASGYTDDQLVSQALLTSRTPLLRKPFTPEMLLTAVRPILAAPDPAPLPAETA